MGRASLALFLPRGEADRLDGLDVGQHLFGHGVGSALPVGGGVGQAAGVEIQGRRHRAPGAERPGSRPGVGEQLDVGRPGEHVEVALAEGDDRPLPVVVDRQPESRLLDEVDHLDHRLLAGLAGEVEHQRGGEVSRVKRVLDVEHRGVQDDGDVVAEQVEEVVGKHQAEALLEVVCQLVGIEAGAGRTGHHLVPCVLALLGGEVDTGEGEAEQRGGREPAECRRRIEIRPHPGGHVPERTGVEDRLAGQLDVIGIEPERRRHGERAELGFGGGGVACRGRVDARGALGREVRAEQLVEVGAHPE